MTAGRLRLVTLLAFLGFFGTGAGWAMSTPWDGGPDEQAHITRAVGVVKGGFTAGPDHVTVPGLEYPLAGVYQNVPADDVHVTPPCFVGKPGKVPSDCRNRNWRPGPSGTDVRYFTTTGRYQPTYGLLVGWPLRWWPGTTGLLLSRLVAAALAAGLLAFAVRAAVGWARRPMLLAGILVGATPMALHLTGVINPNGLEIAAAVAMWTALVPLVLDRDRPVDRRLLVLAGIAAALLAWTRPAGPGAVAVAGIVLLLTAGRERLLRLVRDRAVLWTTGLVLSACLASGVWTLVMKATELVPQPYGRDLGIVDAAQLVLVERISFYLKSMVGFFGWVDVPLPDGFYAVWFAAAGFLALTALVVGHRTDRLRLAVAVAVAFALPLEMDVVGAKQDGMTAQGRYILPFAVGAALIAAYTISERSTFGPAVSRSLLGWLAVAVLPMHFVALAYTMVRYQHGLVSGGRVPSINPLTGRWIPPWGAFPPVAAAVLGLAALGTVVWFATRISGKDGHERLHLQRGHAPGDLGHVPGTGPVPGGRPEPA
ncbi:DUF2142 domain-containing protein [Spirillospora sp. NPDC052269]